MSTVFSFSQEILGFWLTIVLFVAVGVTLLKLGAEWLVGAASNLGIRVGMSSLLVGLTIVAFGTSMPELVVSVMTAIGKQPAICLGNVVGSNIANIGIVLGLTLAIIPVHAKNQTVRKDAPLALLVALLVFGLAVVGAGYPLLSRFDGFLLLAVFAGWMFYMIRDSKKSGLASAENEEIVFVNRSLLFDILLILIGLAALVTGADALVRGASSAAKAWGVSDAVIGLTVVAIGTSLPELAVCVVAAIRKQAGIVLGNVLGSNIFNALLILGTCLVIEPIPFKQTGSRDLAGDFGTVFVDIPVSVFFSLILFLFLLRKPLLGRKSGWLFMICYGIYLTTLVLRSTSLL